MVVTLAEDEVLPVDEELRVWLELEVIEIVGVLDEEGEGEAEKPPPNTT